jgi:hypothetical protein
LRSLPPSLAALALTAACAACSGSHTVTTGSEPHLPAMSKADRAAGGISRSFRRSDSVYASRTFTQTGVRDCLRRARTSHGFISANEDGPGPSWHFHTTKGLLGVVVLVADVSRQEVGLGFTGGGAEQQTFERRVEAASRGVEAPYREALVIRRRGNVVFFYSPAADREVVRIVQGCLGGPVYHGNGGTAPPGLPVPTAP